MPVAYQGQEPALPNGPSGCLTFRNCPLPYSRRPPEGGGDAGPILAIRRPCFSPLPRRSAEVRSYGWEVALPQEGRSVTN